MEPGQGVRCEDDLIVVLDEEVEHVGDEDDEEVGRAVGEGPWKLGERTRRAGLRMDRKYRVRHSCGWCELSVLR